MFQGHLFDIRNLENTTVARHFASHGEAYTPPIYNTYSGIYKSTQDISQFTVTQRQEKLTWIHKLNTIITQWP